MRSTTRIAARKSSIGGFYVCAGGFDILIFNKLNCFVVFNTSNWGRRGLFGEDLAQQTPPVATRMNTTRPFGQWNLILVHLPVATFPNIVKLLKQREYIWIMFVRCSYFDKMIYLF